VTDTDRPARRKRTTKATTRTPGAADDPKGPDFQAGPSMSTISTPGKITTRQMRELHGALREHGIIGDAAVHAYLTSAGHPVESRADLDTVVTAQIIAELEAAPVRHGSIEAALIAFQAEMPVVGKNQTADIPTKNGGSFSYSYADLADVSAAAMPLLTRHGLAFTCCPRSTEWGYELTGVLLHVSGGRIEGSLPLHGNTPQDIGSALTYARRYLLGCMTGIVTDNDDDGRAAHGAQRSREWDGPSTAEYLRQIETDAARAGASFDFATERFRQTRGITIAQLEQVNPWEIQPLANAVRKRADEVQAAASAAPPPQTPAAAEQPYYGPSTAELLEQIADHADRAGTTLEEITAKFRAEHGDIGVEHLGTLPPQALAPLEARIAQYLADNPPATPPVG
jgi:hypothetical protein